jgi:hypothetical protein
MQIKGSSIIQNDRAKMNLIMFALSASFPYLLLYFSLQVESAYLAEYLELGLEVSLALWLFTLTW